MGQVNFPNLLVPGQLNFCNYTSGIYADGYILFAFPFVGSYVRLFVHSLVIPERSWNLCQSL